MGGPDWRTWKRRPTIDVDGMLAPDVGTRAIGRRVVRDPGRRDFRDRRKYRREIGTACGGRRHLGLRKVLVALLDTQRFVNRCSAIGKCCSSTSRRRGGRGRRNVCVGRRAGIRMAGARRQFSVELARRGCYEAVAGVRSVRDAVGPSTASRSTCRSSRLVFCCMMETTVTACPRRNAAPGPPFVADDAAGDGCGRCHVGAPYGRNTAVSSDALEETLCGHISDRRRSRLRDPLAYFPSCIQATSARWPRS